MTYQVLAYLLVLEMRKKICRANAYQSFGLLLAANLHCPELAPILVSELSAMQNCCLFFFALGYFSMSTGLAGDSRSICLKWT